MRQLSRNTVKQGTRKEHSPTRQDQGELTGNIRREHSPTRQDQGDLHDCTGQAVADWFLQPCPHSSSYIVSSNQHTIRG